MGIKPSYIKSMGTELLAKQRDAEYTDQTRLSHALQLLRLSLRGGPRNETPFRSRRC